VILERRREPSSSPRFPNPEAQGQASRDGVQRGEGLSTEKQQYDPTSIINEVRQHVDTWRNLPSSQWQVTPETARLLQHWRNSHFGTIRPFFCQIEAARR